jgi:radical SAM superfamily enzyme YgiQ (UPF0313 family)
MARAGIKNLKLYFMVGLPTEERMDVEEIPILVRRFLGALTMGSGKKRFPGEISISLNPFVPKPWTPFQWHPQENTKSLKEKISIIRDELKRNPEIRVSGESPRSAEVQGILTRGDQKLAKILIKVLENDGNWTRTIREENFNSDFYLYRPRFQDEILPWDFIQPGVKRQYLMDEYHRALNRKTTKPCRPEKCKICGAC